jgi:Zn-dependent peptidase ImmA (M78 family)
LIEIGWGDRVLTFEDFERVAGDKGIWVYKVKMVHDEGLHYYHRDVQPVIVLNKDLEPGDLVWKAFHELGHCLMHPTGLYYFAQGTTEKADYEANFVSSVSLIPTPLFESKTFEEIQEEYGYPNELKWLRKEYYERYRK